ncbi:DUF4181 domain-containing protein [Cytobacillus gottheilii]|uniref:DUF4181 domain-containing protein n=1 Tax=Cytobacillus gottheilii TaxID=859144 RepID=UPI0021471E01|nr:DUF4181 domain-containing protein [Cytobacillus gottheilii]
MFFALERGLVKVFGIKRKSLSESAGKKIDQWGRGIILVAFLSVLLFVLEVDFDIRWFLIYYLIISFGFQMVIEWVYLKKNKQYIITFTFLLLTVPIIYHIEFLI